MYWDTILSTTAPPGPRSVQVELISPVVLRVSWSPPRVIDGQIQYYTIYATPLITGISGRNRRQVESPLATLTKVDVV